ncbi:kinase-like protein [Gigaspora margarita]|uniref:Kinase-like protein n=1 Tax=Gigaspora margarita TaxID=4874 RepID=A0A8H3XBR4_GIGMA|nr:kinase-like protein [Gigaspora margarita]
MVFSAKNIQENFQKLTKEFDTCINDLHFAVSIVYYKQQHLDKQKIESDLKNVIEYLQKIDDKFDLSTQKIKLSLEKKTLNIQVKRIDQSQITDPSYPKDDYSHGSEHLFVVKKYFNENEVACKHIQDSNTIQKHLAIFAKLSESQLQHILRFYRLTCINNYEFMIHEWASYENLKEVYNKYQISVIKKAQIVFDIYNGLSFLYHVNIFHHDVRYDQILYMEPKILNFKYSRFTNAKGSDISKDFISIINWMAPEKISKNQKATETKTSTNSGYSRKCEIFSFGMLIWELCYEKIPYQGLEFTEIMEHVLKGMREETKLYKLKNIKNSDDLIIYKELIKIVKRELGCSIENNIALDFNDIYTNDEDKSFELNKIILTEEGIKLYNKGNRKDAWNCFVKNSELGDPIAKYWQDVYLMEGKYALKNPDKAIQIFKKAADTGTVDAQIQYTHSLKQDPNFDKLEYLHYIKLAASKGNKIAQYVLDEHYLGEKHGIKPNKEIAIHYLRLLSLQSYDKATQLLATSRDSNQ